MRFPLAAPLVLIVDDEPDQVEMYCLGLESVGFRVVSAFTGTDGMRSARELRPHAIVLDLRLPDMSGWEVCATLKRETTTATIPIVILTAAAMPLLDEQAKAAGCAAFLLKPCFPDELARHLRAVIAPPLEA
jgi:two-component system phosphate regulon response regulator PhoB